MSSHDFRERVFNLQNAEEFDDLSLEIFNHQAQNNAVYKQYIKNLKFKHSGILSTRDIPFLPIEFFRNHRILTGSNEPVLFFESSGTTGGNISRHYISDPGIYEQSFLTGFKHFFGDPGDYFFAALLPSYSERGNSSLVYMIERLIKESRDLRSGFFLNQTEELIATLQKIRSEGKKGMLIGVSFALLELAENHSSDLSGIELVETGGMKGRRKEITREELHSVLKAKFNIENIYSEYGMTELLSQAWSKGDGIFDTPPWMKVLIRDSYDPLTILNEKGMTGGINIIDLANINSCSFIATGDLGRLNDDEKFEVLGRFDNSDIRGCNLMLA